MKVALLIAALLAQTQNIVGLREQNGHLHDIRDVGADEPSWVLVAGWTILDHRAKTGEFPGGAPLASFWRERAMTVLRESDPLGAVAVDSVLDRQKAGGSLIIPEVAALWTKLLARATERHPASAKSLATEAVFLGARPPPIP